MSEIFCKIKIKIRDYYPKLKIIPYNNYYCSISYNEHNLTIPLKNKENVIFESEPKKIVSDLDYNISLHSKEKKYLISKSFLIVPYIRIIQVIKMKTLKYEQQIRLLIERNIREKIFGYGISVGSIFLKFNIEIVGTKELNSNLVLYNNINLIKNIIKPKPKNDYDFNISSSITNYTNIKNKENLKITENLRFDKQNRKYSAHKNSDDRNNKISINKKNKSKSNYLYTQTSPFILNNYYKNQSEQFFSKKKFKRIYQYFSPKNNFKKMCDKEITNNNINLKKYCSKKMNNEICINNEGYKNDYFLPNCFSEMSIKEKKQRRKEKSERKNNNFEINKYLTLYKEDNKIGNSNEYNIKNKTIENNKFKNEKSKKINKKPSERVNNKSYIYKSKLKNINQVNDSINKINKKYSKKSKTSKNFYKKGNNQIRNQQIKIKENKSTEPIINLYENKYKEFDFIKPVNNQEELKNNILSMINYFKDKSNEINLSYINNINKEDFKYLLYREKIVLGKKKNYSLQSQNDIKNFKNFIHVKINSKYNNGIFNKISKIKIKEFNIINIILHNRNQDKSNNNPKEILQQKLRQQKEIHVLLNLIRGLIKYYGNLSHLYDEDNNKKILIKSLFLRYNIREKEWNKNDNLIEIYNKMINEIKNNNQKKYNIKKMLSIKEGFKSSKEEDNEIDEEEENINKENEDNNININENVKEICEENKEEHNGEIKYKEKEKMKILVNEEKMKENINNENINKNENFHEHNTKENVMKYENNNNVISMDENINTNNISNELMKNKNIIINNFIIK